jgi:hypothetical protein
MSFFVISNYGIIIAIPDFASDVKILCNFDIPVKRQKDKSSKTKSSEYSGELILRG